MTRVSRARNPVMGARNRSRPSTARRARRASRAPHCRSRRVRRRRHRNGPYWKLALCRSRCGAPRVNSFTPSSCSWAAANLGAAQGVRCRHPRPAPLARQQRSPAPAGDGANRLPAPAHRGARDRTSLPPINGRANAKPPTWCELEAVVLPDHSRSRSRRRRILRCTMAERS